MPKKSFAKCAVLVLNYNGQHFLETCFKSLLQQTHKNFDIWLVDNDSSDNSREWTEKNFPMVKVFNTHGNLAFAGAYNAIHAHFKKKQISYEFYYFLNNDTQSDMRTIEHIVHTFAQSDSIGIVTPTIVNAKGSIDALGGTFLLPFGTTLGYRNGQKYVRRHAKYDVFWASGCALAIRSHLFDTLGGFGDFFIYYEDLDLSWRIQNAGYHVVALESTYVEHLQGGAKTPSATQLYLNERNRIWSYWRNVPRPIFFLLLPVVLASRIVFLPFFTGYSLPLMFAKVKGNRDALRTLGQQPPAPVSLGTFWRVMKKMNTVERFFL